MAEPMTSQEVFDTVARHLFAQGYRATDDSGEACMYRGAAGAKCAVGVLIPDDEYLAEFEGCQASDLWAPSLRKLDAKLLGRLQGVHDGEEFWEAADVMRRGLRRIASDFDLSDAIISALSFPGQTP